MDSHMLIIALAGFTIAGTLLLAFLHFGLFLRHPKNLEAAKRVKEDRESWTTKVASNIGNPAKPLRQRLDESEASIACRSAPWVDVHTPREERMIENHPPVTSSL